jgi:alkylation response protein AidB-like acyl-CoA dehydrogenase
VDAGKAHTEERAAFRQELRSFSKANASPRAVRALLDDPAGFEPAAWEQMTGQLGLPGLVIGEEYGGSGAGYAEAVIALEELGASLLPSPFLPGLIATATLLTAGTGAADNLLTAVAAGHQRVALATASADPGGEHRTADPVTASCTGGQWRLTGSTDFVLDGAGADVIAAVAATADGTALLCAEGSAPGLTRIPLETLDLTRRQARVTFSEVPARLVIDPGQAGWPARASSLAALILAADQLGGIRQCLETATGYARERTAFGRPIGSFQAVKHICADMLVDLECTRAAVEHAAGVADNEAVADGSALMLACSTAKAYASDAYAAAAASLIQVLGGLGFTWEHEAHLYYRRAHSDEQLFGNAAFHRAQIAAALVVTA